MTEETKFRLCRAGLHDQCIGGYEQVTVVGGVVLPPERCSCDCGHTAQKERDPSEGMPA